MMPEETSIRLQKYLAECGFGSRRACEKLILAGRVEVDGQVVTELGTRVTPACQRVRCNGELAVKEPLTTLILNKPPRIICTSNDPQGRTTALDLIEDLPARVYTVGRLDFMSEGLILITNDGELAHALMHPRYHIQKVYRVWVDEPVGFYQLQKMIRGIAQGGETLRMLEIEEQARTPRGVEYRVVLGEGRNRQIRRMMEHFGKKVLRLQRIAIGPLRLENLPVGAWREVKPAELKRLRAALSEAKNIPSEKK